MKSIDIIGIGSAFIDYFYEVDEIFLRNIHLQSQHSRAISNKEFIKTFSSLPLLAKSMGGATLITLSILKKLEMDVKYTGVIGDDKEGILLQNEIENISGEIWRKGSTAHSACLLSNKRKDRSFLYTLNEKEIDFFEKLDFSYINSTRYVHITPLYGNIEISLNKIIEIVSHIYGPKISFCPALVYTDLGLKRLEPILEKTDIIFFSKEELEILFTDIEKGSKELLSYGPKIVVCTLGEKGSLITTREKQFLSHGKHVSNIIDSTGAGDAFAAGFLYGLLQNKSLEWSAKFANTIAAQAITDLGLHWLDKLDKKQIKEFSILSKD